MTDCCFHIMANGKKEGDEIFCRIPGKKHKMLCPSYRGISYRQELDRIASCVEMIRPDYVFFDIEAWGKASQSAAECERCKEERRRSGKSLDAFLLDCGTNQQRDLRSAVEQGAKTAGIKCPVIGSYNRQPLHDRYQIESFRRIHPDFIDLAVPSLYVGGRAADVRDNVRGNAKLLKNKNLIPWLTAGTYGEFDSKLIEPMVLEAFLNGAGGISYYKYQDFTDSPLDFYYHASALVKLRPYENLIADGTVFELTSSRPEIICSALRRDKEILLLVSNYDGYPQAASVTLPFENVVEIRDVCGGTPPRPDKTLSFDVPRGWFRLFYIRGQ